MAAKTPTIHVFIVCFPAQGQINPLLRLGKRLASMGGFLVTLATTSEFGQKISNATGISPGHLSPVGDGFLRFEFIEESVEFNDTFQDASFLHHLERVVRERVPLMLRRLADEGRPVNCLITGSLVPYVYDIANELGIPVATMWAQSCAAFLTFVYCYNKLVPFPTKEDPYIDVEIPTLPLLKWDELHSFLHPNSPKVFAMKPWLDEFSHLNKPFCILMDTFDELEHEIISFSSQLCPIIKPVGPLFKDPISVSSIRGDHIKADFDCLRWLDSKPRNSVIYISFGSLAHLKQEQINEIANGLLSIGAPFLWVLKPPVPNTDRKPHTLPEGFIEKTGENGIMVEFCPQEEVLAHVAVSCFVSHCGWNSMMEAITSGVPIVAFPLWGDQLTTAKLLVEMYGVAVKMGRGEHDPEVVPREEIMRCIRVAMVGPKADKMRMNALLWKEKALKACQQGGSSFENLKSFVEEIRRRSTATIRSGGD